MTKGYLIPRDSIYAGQVVEINYLKENLLGDFSTEYYVPYRSILFTLTDELWAQDLLYDSPLYPIINTTDKNTIMKIKINNRSFFAIVNSCNLGPLLEYLGYDMYLSKNDLEHIRNTIFSSNFLKNNCDIFGLMKKPAPSYYIEKNFKNIPSEELDIYGYNNANYFRKINLMLQYYLKKIKGIQEFEFTDNVNCFFETMKLRDEYLNVLDKLKDDNILSVFHKTNVQLDAFKPSKEEGKIKRLKKERELNKIK